MRGFRAQGVVTGSYRRKAPRRASGWGENQVFRFLGGGNATFDHIVAMRFLDCRVSGYSAALG
jgi:hypothetical protein